MAKWSTKPATLARRSAKLAGLIGGANVLIDPAELMIAGGTGRRSALLNNTFAWRPRGSAEMTHVAGSNLRPLPGWGVTCRNNVATGGAKITFTDIGLNRRAMRVTRPEGMANADQWIVFQALSLERSARWAGKTPRMALAFRRGAGFDGVFRLGCAYMVDGVERVVMNQGALHATDVDLANAVLGAGTYPAGSWHFIDHLFTEGFPGNATQVLFYMFWIPTANPAVADSWFELAAVDVVDAADFAVEAPAIPVLSADEERMRCAELAQVFDLPCGTSPAVEKFAIARMLRTPAIEAQPGETLPAGFSATGSSRQHLVMTATAAGTVKGIASAEL